MTFLLTALVKTSLVLLATFAALALLRRGSAALRHWILAIGILCAAATPLLGGVLPALTLTVSPLVWQTASPPVTPAALSLSASGVGSGATPAPTPAAPAGAVAGIDTLVVAAWAVGATVALALLGAGAVRLKWLAARATPIRSGPWSDINAEIARHYGLTRPVTLLHSDHPTLLVTWGVFRPKVIVPETARTWTAERIRIVLGHELAHVRRRDWGIQIAAALLRCACWCNPLVWLACARLRRESEYASDDLVLGHGVGGQEYATHLLEVARALCQSRRHWMPAQAIAHPSTLERRIRAMLNDSRNRAPLTPLTRIGSVLALMTASLGIAAAALSAATTPTTDALMWGPPSLGAEARSAEVPGGPSHAAPGVSRPLIPTPASAPAGGSAAQAARGSLSGVVSDQLGGFVPGTDLTLTSVVTGAALVTVAGRGGAFEFRDLTAGEYVLEARLPGFQNVRVPLSVAAGAAHQRRIVLPIGSLQETITVMGSRAAPAGAPEPSPGPAAGRGRGQTGGPPQGGRGGNSVEALRESLNSLANQTTGASSFRAGTIGGEIKAPVKLLHVSPIYPSALQSAGIDGVVSLVTRIGSDGFVVEALLARDADAGTAPHPDLVAAAIAAVREWKFTPTLLNGVPVEVNMTASISFTLR
jgi:beta-lactamase regulating signal transducer with metallopeptidase domain